MGRETGDGKRGGGMSFLSQEHGQPEKVSWDGDHENEQALLSIQIHQELAAYNMDALQAALEDEDQDWEALFA